MKRVIVIDDEPAILTVIARSLRSRGFVADCYGKADDFLVAVTSICESNPACAIISDIEMGSVRGHDLIDLALQLNPTMRGKILFLTASSDPNLIMIAQLLGRVVSKMEINTSLVSALQELCCE